jgi:hypothetical protein
VARQTTNLKDLRTAIAGRAKRTDELSSDERRQRSAHEWRKERTAYWLDRYNRDGDEESLRKYRRSRSLGRRSRRTVMAMRERTEASRAKLRYWRRLLRRQQTAFQPWMLNGKAGNVIPAAKRFIVRAVNAGLYVTSTTGDTHTPTSYHYAKPLGRAVDVAGPWEKMIAFQRAESAARPGDYLELFGPDNAVQIKNGQRFAFAEGQPLENLHDTHVHGALR